MRRPEDPVEVLRPLRRVRQVRQFTGEPVASAEVDAIADVGRWSGSSRNSQPWRFITIDDGELIGRIASADLPHSRALTTATAAIAVVVPAGPETSASYAYDEGRAAERMLIAATQLGLGGGLMWVSTARRDTVGAMLGLPEDRQVRTIVALGHPTPEALAAKNPPGQARLPRDRVVAHGRWRGELAGD